MIANAPLGSKCLELFYLSVIEYTDLISCTSPYNMLKYIFAKDYNTFAQCERTWNYHCTGFHLFVCLFVSNV